MNHKTGLSDEVCSVPRKNAMLKSSALATALVMSTPVMGEAFLSPRRKEMSAAE